MVDSSRPIRPAMIPLSIFLPEMLAMMVRPNTARQKYSGGPNFRASLASWGATQISTKALMVPPIQEAKVERPMARPPSPRAVNCRPSIMVAAEAGVPGVPMRMAVMEPP